MSNRLTAFVGCCCLSAVVGAVVLAGCGGPTHKYDNADLSGSVTIDGAAAESGRVTFSPEPGNDGVPVTADITAGKYEAKQVPLGKVRATFAITKATGKMISEGDRVPYPEVISIVPAKYAQGVSVNITGDNNAQNFDLTTAEEPK